MLAGCAHDEVEAPRRTPAVTPDETGAVYMRLRLTIADPDESDTRSGASTAATRASAAATRANPSGGEEGDGPEEAINHEAEIEDVALFIYNDVSGEGLNAPGATPILASFYLTENDLTELNCSNNMTFGREYVISMNDYEYAETHRIAVVVNSGGLCRNFENLGELRSYYGPASRYNGESLQDTRHFLMSNAYAIDGAITLCHSDKGSMSDPNFHCSVSVERMAARIDIMAREAEMKTDEGWLEYSIKNGKNEEIALARLTDILPVNVRNQGSYLFKHVTRTALGGFSLADQLVCGEETLDGVYPTNYVVEPMTASKVKGLNDATLETYYGETAAHKRLKTTDEEWSAGALGNYLPAAFPIKPSENRGNNRSFILSYADENTQHASLHISDFLTGLLMRGSYIPKRIYRDTKLEEFDVPAGPTTFWRFKPTVREFSEEQCVYFETEQLAKDYAKLHPTELGEISGYPGGICYYHVWIRHAFDEGYDPHAEPFPMEYGIVRNNIYRLGFTIFGPGTPKPTLDEPETIALRIFVRKWNLRELGTIIL